MRGLTTRRWAVRGFVLLPFAVLAGCGGRDEPRPAATPAPDPPAPASHPAPAPTPPGQPTAAAPPTPAGLPTAPAPRPKPKGVATPVAAREVVKVIDLRTFPRLDGAKPERAAQSPLAQVAYEAPGTVQKAVDFYAQKLAEAGWEEHYPGEKRHVHKEGKSEFAMITATKQAFVLSVHMSGEVGKDEVRVSVFSTGNFDTRTLPRTTDAASTDDAGTFPNYSHTMYTTADTVEAAEAFTRKAMAAAGWQEYSDRLSDNRRVTGSLDFRNRAVHIGVYISTAPALGNKTAVQYNAGVLSDDVPTPADATDVRLEDRELFRLQCETGSSVQQVVDFYKKELPALGWTFREKAGFVKDDSAFLFFDADNKDYLAIDVKRQPKGRTLVKVVHFPPEKETAKPGSPTGK